jgi:DNA repair exonuclease SbcCD ATPase subunit
MFIVALIKRKLRERRERKERIKMSEISKVEERISLVEVDLKEVKKLKGKVAKIKDLENDLTEMNLTLRNIQEAINRLTANLEAMQADVTAMIPVVNNLQTSRR